MPCRPSARCTLEFASRAPDMMAVSAHKIGGPAGVGALLVKGHADQVRLIPGGGQETGRRGGTEAAALIAGFGAAAEAFPDKFYARQCQRADPDGRGGDAQYGARPRGVRRSVPTRIGNVSNFAVPGLKNAVAMMGLDLMGISVSSGSACSSGKVGPSHVLKAMGVPPELSECAMRLSVGWNSTEADIAAFLEGFSEVLGRHRERRTRRLRQHHGRNELQGRHPDAEGRDRPRHGRQRARARRRQVQIRLRDRDRERARADRAERRHDPLHLGQEERAATGCSSGGSRPIAAG